MIETASPVSVEFRGGASVAAVLDTLGHHGERPLLIEYAERTIQPGYHVTEVKAGSFVTLDCGGAPDGWNETVLQVEDLPLEASGRPMTAGRFKAILAKAASTLALDMGSRMTFEVGRPDEAMRIFDVRSVRAEPTAVWISLAPRPAVCKPRHREALNAPSRCCAGQPQSLSDAQPRPDAVPVSSCCAPSMNSP